MKVLIHAVVATCALLALIGSAHLRAQGFENPRQDEAKTGAEAWLTLLDQGLNEEAYALLADVAKAHIPLQEWRDSNVKTQAMLGKLETRRLTNVVWYQDPAGAPLPGTYVLVEFTCTYSNSAKVTDGVTLHSLSGEPFKIMGQKITLMEDRASQSVKP